MNKVVLLLLIGVVTFAAPSPLSATSPAADDQAKERGDVPPSTYVTGLPLGLIGSGPTEEEQ